MSAVSPHPEGTQDGFPTHGQLTAALRNLSSHVPSQELTQNSSPTYAQLADALRNLTSDVPTQDNPSPGFPSYVQLNAAPRNLVPDTPLQDTFAEGFPTYTQLAQALRDLSPATPSPINESPGFFTYAQLAAALRALPPVPTSRRIRVLRYASLGELNDFVAFPRHALPPHCGTMLWPLELPNACCLRGHVALAPANTPPERVRQLFNTPSFLEKIRGYNSAFAFTSTGAKEDSAINRGNAPYTFRVNGSMHHRIGHLLPRDGAAPAFEQIYFYDGSTEEQVALRGSTISSGLNPIILGKLQTILNDVNPLAATYRSAREYADSSQEMCLVLFEKPNTDPRRYNRPTAEEVAAIMDNGDPAISRRDVVLHYRSGVLLRIFETHPLYDPLQYPLIYLRGEEG
ncbi:hypothetical protein PI124_g533 [Phytophthora idaei]|nr:hypothetical protein PI125_g4253 [Phytophthora idaei]KAG3167298.1 hypothetical protein PI126_g3848 [Phytophthora idaei]KAG3254875.1 hypothetical protein PI124_g533 [Phytophthora idaei]